jgi:hypothetical protein
MPTEQMDLTVFAKDYPEFRLVVELRPSVSSPPDQDATVKQVARHMWGANCHYGLIMTPVKTYVLRDDFTRPGPESIHVTDVLPTPTLLRRVGYSSADPVSFPQLELLARAWLERLASSYETALPEDPDVVRALFPEIVGAVAGGRVVGEAAAL